MNWKQRVNIDEEFIFIINNSKSMETNQLQFYLFTESSIFLLVNKPIL